MKIPGTLFGPGLQIQYHYYQEKKLLFLPLAHHTGLQKHH